MGLGIRVRVGARVGARARAKGEVRARVRSPVALTASSCVRSIVAIRDHPALNLTQTLARAPKPNPNP